MNRSSPHRSFNGPCTSVDEERGLRCSLSGDHAKCVFTVPVDAPCSRCNGTGSVTYSQVAGGGRIGYNQFSRPCPVCRPAEADLVARSDPFPESVVSPAIEGQTTRYIDENGALHFAKEEIQALAEEWHNLNIDSESSVEFQRWWLNQLVESDERVLAYEAEYAKSTPAVRALWDRTMAWVRAERINRASVPETVESLALEMYEADSSESEGAIGVADRIACLNDAIRTGMWTVESTADWNRVRPRLGDRIAAFVERAHRATQWIAGLEEQCPATEISPQSGLPKLPEVCRSCGHERNDHLYGDDTCVLRGCGCPSFDAEPLPPVPSPTLCVLRSEYDAVVKRAEEEERLSTEWHRKAADRRRDADWLRRMLSLALVHGLAECERLRAKQDELRAALYTYRGSVERVVQGAIAVERARVVTVLRERAKLERGKGEERAAHVLREIANDIEASK